MNEEHNPFDKKIKSALEFMPEPTPPTGGWDTLKKRLMDEGLLKKRKRRYFFFILITGAALSLALWFARKEDNTKIISQLPAEAINPGVKNNHVQIAEPAEMTEKNIPAIKTKPSPVESASSAQPEKSESVGQGNEKLPVTVVPEPLPEHEFKKENIKDVPKENENILVESKNTGNDDIPDAEKEIKMETNTISSEKSNTAEFPGEARKADPVNNQEPDIYAIASPQFIPIIPAGILYNQQEENPGVLPPPVPSDNASILLHAPDVVQSRWRIGIYSGWDRNMYRISKAEKSKEENFYSPLDSVEIKNFQSTLGFFGGYLLNCHIEIHGGIRYSQKQKFYSVFGEMSDNPTDSTSFNYRYDFSGKYLEVPVQVSYNFRVLNQVFYATAAIIPTFNLPDKDHDYFSRTVYNPAGTRWEQVNLKSSSMGISASAGIGMKVHIYKGITVFIEPGWQYALNPVIKHPTYDKMPVNPFINTMSIGAGVIYIFNTRQRTRPSLCL